MDTTTTPMLRQYHEIKQKHFGTLLFFRMGDFYELFYDDAVTAARELEITLTARNKERGNPVPMCGVPHHAAAGYIAKLVKKGFRVAICDQTEAPSKTTKLVKREVVRVITPGTAIDEQLLETRESVYLCAVYGSGEIFGAAFLELSTGEFRATERAGADAWQNIAQDIESYAPREILFPASMIILLQDTFGADDLKTTEPNQPETVPLNTPTNCSFQTTLTELEDWIFNDDYASSLLLNHFGVKSLSGYGFDGKTRAVCAAGACLRYAQETQKASAAHISDLNYFEPSEVMILDAVSLRNLEIIEANGDGGKARSLYGVIDATVTGMGSRLLKQWILRPSIKRAEIETRLAAVDELTDSMRRDNLRRQLKDVFDLERLIGRLNLNTATPRDLLALARSLKQVPRLRQTLSDAKSSLLQVLRENITELPETISLIDRAISDEPPVNFADGGIIRDGFHQELDELRAISRDAKSLIAQIEEREKSRTGINTLRVKFNNVFGYFIEVSKQNAARVPADYERRQTLTNAERFTTPELKEWERKVLGAEERIGAIELEIFQNVRAEVTKQTKILQTTARALATLDTLAALAETAQRRNFVRPILHDGDEMHISEGRHPVIEAFLGDSFVPNDLQMNNSDTRLLIITGPNMGGKSTILRQTALIQILAQIGSFVPAKSAKLPLVDRVWTRVGASDDLARGRSTFMVEMTETAAILHNATPRSLVLLDEIGRGTSTFDGLSIAWAVAEHLHDSPQNSAKTLFATHYHELTELAERLFGAKNFQITATERNGEVVFLHKLENGRAEQSYGIAVAKLAGLPSQVVRRAKEVLQKLERYELDVFAEDSNIPKTAQNTIGNDAALERAVSRSSRGKMAMQATLFQTANETVVEELRNFDVSNLNENDLKEIILEWQKKII